MCQTSVKTGFSASNPGFQADAVVSSIVISAKTTDVTEPLAPELQGILDAVCYAP